jgi:hypothetical protein
VLWLDHHRTIVLQFHDVHTELKSAKDHAHFTGKQTSAVRTQHQYVSCNHTATERLIIVPTDT